MEGSGLHNYSNLKASKEWKSKRWDDEYSFALSIQ